MSKARELAELGAVYDSGALSNRNMIINGAFIVAQRGTSSTSSGIQTVDRTNLIYGGTDEAPTQAQVDVASGTTPYSLGFRKAFKVTNGNQTSGAQAADYIQFEQGIEAQNVHDYGWDSTSTSSFITMSFWIKSSVARTFQGSFRVDDSTKIYNWDTGALSADTWTKVTKTITGASGVTINNDTGLGLQWIIWPYLGTNYTGGGSPNVWKTHDSNDWAASTDDTSWYTTNDATCEITGLQIEVSPEATPFEHRSFGDELIRCYRYYQQLTNTVGTVYIGINQPYSTNSVFGMIKDYIVPMRAVPTVSQSGNFAFAQSDSTAINSGAIGNLAAGPSGWYSGGWTGGSGMVYGGASVVYWENGAKLKADAEL